MRCYVIVLCTLLAIATAAKVNYNGHMVIRVTPETKEQMDYLLHLEATSSIDFWSFSRSKDEPTDIRVSPETYNHVARLLLDMKMNHKIYIADLGKLIQEEEQAIALRRALYNGKAIDLENYHTYEEIMAWLDDLVLTNRLVSKKVAGTTLEGRDIVQAIISSDLTAKRPVQFFDCNIHAREWISAATCVWIIDHLTTNYGTDPEITSLVDQYDWKFVVLTNPDGYAFTWNAAGDRLWRKNRNPNPGAACIGVDANRNFPVGFDGSGASSVACSETYHGVAAFSERESAALRDLIVEDAARAKTAISIHSYSQLWLSSYGYLATLPTDYPEMLRIMTIGVEALTATYGTQYTYGSTGTALYIASGVTTDFYYETQGVIHSYTIELRDTGRFGFLLPAAQIVPTATETWNGIKAMVNAI